MPVADVVDLLACPHCTLPFLLDEDLRSVRCAAGHAFDLARQGYLNLQGREPKNADTAAMVSARERFLARGHYRRIAERVSGLIAVSGPQASAVLEVGAGTGYYLAHAMDGLDQARGVALDVSVAAARRAAKAHPRIGSVVADAWLRMPLADGRLDVVLDVFAPRNAAEFHRLLRSEGLLLTVSPRPDHLEEIRGLLGLLDIQPGKQDQLTATLGEHFVRTEQETLSYGVSMDGDAIYDLVAMGPNAFHLDEAVIRDRVSVVPTPIRVTLAVDLSVWSPLSSVPEGRGR